MGAYYDCIEKTKDTNMALARTNVNCKLLRISFDKRETEGEAGIKYLRVILWNHIIQGYHRTYDIDLYPEYVGDMYGYCVEILNGRKFRGALTSASLRFDIRSEEPKELKELTVSEIYKRNNDILLTIMEGIKFFESYVISKIEKVSTKGNYNYIYENVYQVLTACFCMGKIRFFINGASSSYSLPIEVNSTNCHNYIEVTGNDGDNTYYIKKDTGELLFENGVKIEYQDWCNGKIYYGIEFISRINQSENIPLFLTASIGGYGGTSYTVKFNFAKYECIYESFNQGFQKESHEIIKVDTKKVDDIISNIDRNISGWKNEYMPEELYMDGTSWSIEYITSSKKIKSSGSNAYPDNFDRFCREIGSLIEREFN